MSGSKRPVYPGYKWVCVRFRRVKNSTKVLDAHEYGYKAWCFLVRCKR